MLKYKRIHEDESLYIKTLTVWNFQFWQCYSMLKKNPSLKVYSRTTEFWFYFFSKILHQSCIGGVGIDKGVWMGMEFGGGLELEWNTHSKWNCR